MTREQLAKIIDPDHVGRKHGSPARITRAFAKADQILSGLSLFTEGRSEQDQGGEAITHEAVCAFADTSDDPIAVMLRQADLDTNGASISLHGARLAYAHRVLSSAQGETKPEGSDLPPGRLEDAPGGVTLWGVYGPDCFLTVFCCRVRCYDDGSRAVWGHSTYQGQAGFRTLGTGEAWASENDLRLFDTRDEALRYVASTISAPAAAVLLEGE
jgi:hypothetical protein